MGQINRSTGSAERMDFASSLSRAQRTRCPIASTVSRHTASLEDGSINTNAGLPVFISKFKKPFLQILNQNPFPKQERSRGNGEPKQGQIIRKGGASVFLDQDFKNRFFPIAR